METPSNASDAPHETAPPLPPGWLGRWPWVTFLLPFIVFAVVTYFEPRPPAEIASDPGGGWLPAWLPDIPYSWYPAIYTTKIALTIIAMIAVWPGYRRFPFRISPLALAVGAVGVVLWVGLAKMELGRRLLGPIGLGGFIDSGQRSAFNPLEQLADNPAWAYGFLAIRLIGLALVVPIIEEFFLRGFLMRFVVHDRWQVPFGTATWPALAVGTALPMMMHPGELAAAAVWFSLVSWLMVRTRNIWDCVAAHAVTNGLLGAWVISSGDWHLM